VPQVTQLPHITHACSTQIIHRCHVAFVLLFCRLSESAASCCCVLNTTLVYGSVCVPTHHPLCHPSHLLARRQACLFPCAASHILHSPAGRFIHAGRSLGCALGCNTCCGVLQLPAETILIGAHCMTQLWLVVCCKNWYKLRL
jgi:hypothetical protein